MVQKGLYCVQGRIMFANRNYFVADSATEAAAMYNELIISRNNSFNESNPLASIKDVSFKMNVYVK
jgi:hypothetical protein